MVMDCFTFFFFNDTATTEIYTLSLHDALPIFYRRLFALLLGELLIKRAEALQHGEVGAAGERILAGGDDATLDALVARDRKSTRLNSSHANISYAVFCLKKKKQKYTQLIYILS